MNHLYGLLEQSVLISGFIASLFTCVILYQWATGVSVPDAEAAMYGAIISYFFRTRGEQQAANMVQSIKEMNQRG